MEAVSKIRTGLKDKSEKHPQFTHFNVRGTEYKLLSSTLSQGQSSSLLSFLSRGDTENVIRTGEYEYFINGNSRMFELVVDYHMTGELHLPNGLCLSQIKHELDFWQVSEKNLACCCYNDFCEKLEVEKTLAAVCQSMQVAAQLSSVSPLKKEVIDSDSACLGRSYRIWIFMEDVTSCNIAKIYGTFSAILTLLCMLMLMLDSCTILRTPHPRHQEEEFINASLTVSNPKLRVYVTTVVPDAIHYTFMACMVFLTLETIVRSAVCPDKRLLWKDSVNVIDVFCLIPLWINLGLFLIWHFEVAPDNVVGFFVARTFSMFIGLRLIRHIRKCGLVRVLYLTMTHSVGLNVFLAIILALAVMFFACCIYLAEVGSQQYFHSIPEGFWWAIITMTTVGYGDMYPTTVAGYIVGSLCTVVGIIVLALPIPIISSQFSTYYNAHIRRKRLIARRQKFPKHP